MHDNTFGRDSANTFSRDSSETWQRNLDFIWWWLRNLNSPLKWDIGDSVVTGWFFFFLLLWALCFVFSVSSWVRGLWWARNLVTWCVVVKFCGRRTMWWRRLVVSKIRWRDEQDSLERWDSNLVIIDYGRKYNRLYVYFGKHNRLSWYHNRLCVKFYTYNRLSSSNNKLFASLFIFGTWVMFFSLLWGCWWWSSLMFMTCRCWRASPFVVLVFPMVCLVMENVVFLVRLQCFWVTVGL